jgi:hypothetical protein
MQTENLSVNPLCEIFLKTLSTVRRRLKTPSRARSISDTIGRATSSSRCAVQLALIADARSINRTRHSPDVPHTTRPRAPQRQGTPFVPGTHDCLSMVGIRVRRQRA